MHFEEAIYAHPHKNAHVAPFTGNDGEEMLPAA